MRHGGTNKIPTRVAETFGRCYHGGMVHRLSRMGVTSKMGLKLPSNHYNTVVKQAILSTTENSVPQVTVLTPLLFLIILSDVDANTNHTVISYFADDTQV